MIQLEGLGKTFRPGPTAGRGAPVVRALADLSVRIPEGEAWAVVGANGAGKSTLFALLLGFLHPSEGTISIAGEEPRTYVRRHGAAYLPERFRLPPEWSVRAALSALARLEGLKGRDADARANAAIERFQLEPHAAKPLGTLSRGLLQIKSGDSTYRELATAIQKVNQDAKLYTIIHRYIKDRFKSIYAELNSKEDQEIFIQDLNREIQAKGIVPGPVPHGVFEDIILDIRKESFYLNNLLPHIIVSRDSQVREDFLTNSGLDRFYVEELEKDYFGMNQIESGILEEIRK